MNRLVTYFANQGLTWSPVKLVFDLPYASATEQRIMRLDERRFLSYTRADPLVRTEGWDYERNVVHFSLSEDEGETWSEPWKGNFLGAGAPELHRLNDGSFIIIYRDMDPNRAGVSGPTCISTFFGKHNYVLHCNSINIKPVNVLCL